MVQTAVYLLNYTLKQGLKWKTPYKSFFSTIYNSQENNQPRISYIRIIGYKAFALTNLA
jgi:hypothetical protein